MDLGVNLNRAAFSLIVGLGIGVIPWLWLYVPSDSLMIPDWLGMVLFVPALPGLIVSFIAASTVHTGSVALVIVLNSVLYTWIVYRIATWRFHRRREIKQNTT
jgi:hypothetical protein